MKKTRSLHLFKVLATLFLVGACVACVQAKSLYILTSNDLHGQLEPLMTTRDNKPVEVGGFGRLATVVKKYKKQYPGQVLAVNCGDSLTGKYFLHFRGEATFKTLSALGIDAATLGNHEFDMGPEAPAETLRHCTFPIVETNIDLQPESPFAGIFKKSMVIERAGLRIGLIGLMTPHLTRISQAGVKISASPDLAGAARREVRKLKNEHKADLIVALTHIGVEADMKLAKAVPELDVICGGHSHTLIKTGQEIVIPQPDGRKTMIVQAGARGKHLGVLKLDIDGKHITNHAWEALRLDASIARDPATEAVIESYRSKLPPPKKITRTTVTLDCRTATVRSREAAIGNLICDIMRKRFKTDIALYNGGGIRGDRIMPAGPLTTDDVDSLLPFPNTIVTLHLTGAAVKHLLEQSVSMLPRPYGGFLQVAGLRMQVDPKKTPRIVQTDRNGRPYNILRQGDRIQSVAVQTGDGSFKPLDIDKIYSVAVNSYMAKGGNGFFMLKTARERKDTGLFLHDVVEKYLGSKTEIAPVADGRIEIIKGQ